MEVQASLYPYTHGRRWRSCWMAPAEPRIRGPTKNPTGAVWQGYWDTKRITSPVSSGRKGRFRPCCVTGRTKIQPVWIRFAQRWRRSTERILRRASPSNPQLHLLYERRSAYIAVDVSLYPNPTSFLFEPFVMAKLCPLCFLCTCLISKRFIHFSPTPSLKQQIHKLQAALSFYCIHYCTSASP